jgi:hypothetical protein
MKKIYAVPAVDPSVEKFHMPVFLIRVGREVHFVEMKSIAQ